MSTTTETTRTDNEDALWQAINACPLATASELAATAGIGGSTARKILARWAADGSVTRHTDDTPRTTHRWAITTGTTSDTETPPAQTIPDTVTATTAPGTDAPTEAGPDPAEATGDTEPSTIEPVAQPPAAAPEPLAAPTDKSEPESEVVAQKPDRLAPGALQGMVEDFLLENPAEEFTPGQIGKALGDKSPGAVYNILKKFTDKGFTKQTCDQPRKYMLPQQEPDTATTP